MNVQWHTSIGANKWSKKNKDQCTSSKKDVSLNKQNISHVRMSYEWPIMQDGWPIMCLSNDVKTSQQVSHGLVKDGEQNPSIWPILNTHTPRCI